jgi:hypothetical protein
MALFYRHEGYMIRALQYKQDCLQILKDKIGEGGSEVSDATFATVMTLAFVEVRLARMHKILLNYIISLFQSIFARHSTSKC